MSRDFNKRRLLKWIGLLVLALLVVLAALGFFVQLETDAESRTEHPYTGSFVDVGDHHLHYREHGEGGFTFVLEAGIGGYSGDWGKLEDALAQMGRVFVYDRAGYGWSQEGPGPRSLQQLTQELHSALETARIRKPYILVGHGLGGAIHTRYAMEYPEHVAALLLIEPSHKDQLSGRPEPAPWQEFLRYNLPRLALLGAGRIYFRSEDPVKNRTAHIQTFGAELRATAALAENWDAGPVDLGNIPVYVLTAGDYTRYPGESAAEKRVTWEAWRSRHAELVAASSSPMRKHIVVADAPHYIHRENPEVVVAAARELVEHIAGE